jgi:gamma-glutamyltranspeptidase/glutathione hydrolase
LILGLCFVYLSQGVKAQNNAPLTPEPASPVLRGETARGQKIMVVAAHPEATRVGFEILKSGGGAADAAVAVQLVLGLVEPQSCGLGGGGFALYYDAATKKVHSFDGRETAPATAGKFLFREEDGAPMDFYEAAIGGRAVGVPGMPRLLEMLHGRFGTRPWRDLFSPAIFLADNGFTVTPRLHALIKHDHLKLKNFVDTKLYFFPDSTTPIGAGERLLNPLYARTLRTLAIQGAGAFYNGPLAERMVKTVRGDKENPGLLAIEDFQNYKALERKTVCATYRGQKICTVPEPSSGGLVLLATLGMLEQFNMAALGPENPQSWHLIAEASRLAIADQNFYMADPGEALIDKAYLKERAAQISLQKPIANAMPGTPKGWGQERKAPEPVYLKPPGTTHFTIVDSRGNIVSMTSSIEDMFGSRMFVDGFMLNNQLTDFSFIPMSKGKDVANRVEPGKRPRSSMAPVIMFTPGGVPMLAIGSAGGSFIPGYIVQRIVAIVDWNQPLEKAIAAASIVNRGKGIEMEESGGNLIGPLEKIGHPVTVAPLNSGISAIHWKNGTMIGAADPRREGTAKGE